MESHITGCSACHFLPHAGEKQHTFRKAHQLSIQKSKEKLVPYSCNLQRHFPMQDPRL